MTAENDDALETFTVSGRRIDIGEGRSVFVGSAPDSDSTFLSFINNQGTETRVRISAAATKALKQLLAEPPVRVGEWVLVAKLKDAIASLPESNNQSETP